MNSLLYFNILLDLKFFMCEKYVCSRTKLEYTTGKTREKQHVQGEMAAEDLCGVFVPDIYFPQ